MARIAVHPTMDFSKFLGENLRESDDYCLYLNRALTLWVFSSIGISKKIDPNLSFLYEKQVQAESIGHLNISLRRLIEITSDLSPSYKQILNNQIEQINLEAFFIEDLSHFGEIDKIFKYASKVYNWTQLRILINNQLKIRSDHYKYKKDELTKNLSIMLTVVFGLLGASILIDKSTQEFWYNLIILITIISAFTGLVISTYKWYHE